MYGAPLGMLAAAVISVIISYPCFKLKGHYFAIATFAIVEIFNRLFMIWDTIGGALGLDYPILPTDGKIFRGLIQRTDIISERWRYSYWFSALSDG